MDDIMELALRLQKDREVGLSEEKNEDYEMYQFVTERCEMEFIYDISTALNAESYDRTMSIKIGERKIKDILEDMYDVNLSKYKFIAKYKQIIPFEALPILKQDEVEKLIPRIIAAYTNPISSEYLYVPRFLKNSDILYRVSEKIWNNHMGDASAFEKLTIAKHVLYHKNCSEEYEIRILDTIDSMYEDVDLYTKMKVCDILLDFPSHKERGEELLERTRELQRLETRTTEQNKQCNF